MRPDPQIPPSRDRPAIPFRWACVAALFVPFIVYFYTCAPGIGMGDTAMLVDYVHYRHLSTHAAVHNIAILIGWLFYQLPAANAAWKVNLASVFTGGAAVVLYGFLLFRVLRSRIVALACTAVLMVSHSMWWHSTIAEAYAVNALFTVGALWLLFAPGELGLRRLVALFFVAALAIFNHLQMGIIAVGATVSLLIATFETLLVRGVPRKSRPSVFARVRKAVTLNVLCTLSFVAGLAPWLLVLTREAADAGWSATVYKMKGAGFQNFMGEGKLSEGLADVLYLVFENFPGPFLLAVVPGCVILARRYHARQTWGVAAMFALNTLFFGTYDTWDRFAFLLPSFIMLAFAGSFAVDALWGRIFRPGAGARRSGLRTVSQGALVAALLFSVLFPPWFFSRLSVWGKQHPSIWSERYGNTRSGHLFDFGEYRGNPNKRNWRDAEEFADLIFAKLPRNAIYVDDDSRTYFPIDYFRRFYRKRLDLRIHMINTWGMANWGISRAAFRTEMGNAYYSNRRLFIPTLGSPYKKFLPRTLGKKEPRFERFVLDDRRHVYRLITARESKRP